MGQPELAAALRRSGEEQAREIWAEAERQAAVAAQRAERQRQQLRSKARHRRRALLAEQLASERLAADERLRRNRADLHRSLSEKAQRQAGAQLPVLDTNRPRAELFAAFAAELPDCAWEEIRIAAADEQTARQRFPAARVQVDEQTAGGLLALAGQGRITVDNRLETRLRRAWPNLLSRLWQRLRAELEADDAAV